MLLSKIWLRISLVIISALLSALSFYKFDLLIFVSFIPFLYSLSKTATLKGKFVSGFLWGIVFFSLLCHWLRHVTILGLIILVLILSCFPAAFSFLFGIKGMRLYYLPLSWVALEYLRSFILTGFPWGMLGYAICNRMLAQIADIFGTYGVSFLILYVNTFIFYLFQKDGFKKKLPHTLIFALLLISSVVYANYRFNSLTPDAIIKRVALIQPNIDTDIKWDINYFDQVFEKTKTLSLLAKYEGTKFIILPETIIPVAWGKDKEVISNIREFVREVGIPMLMGLPFIREGFYNSSMLFSPLGEVRAVYFKNKLVPFGEYIPLEGLLSFLRNNYDIGCYKKGKKVVLFDYNGYKFSVLICYEDIFPELVRRRAKLGSAFLVNQSDEGWFKKSKEIYLHNQIACLRAIENRRTILRATNTGLTCIIDYKGNIVAKLDPFKADFLIADVPIYRGNSFYTLYGWLFAPFTLIFVLWNLLKERILV